MASCHLIIWDVFYKLTQAYSFHCWFSNNSIQSFFVRMLFKFNSGTSCHLHLRSFLSNDLACILLFRRQCDVSLLDPLYRFAKIMFFPCLSILQEFCVLYSSSFHLIKLCFSFLPECYPNSFILVPFLSWSNQSGFIVYLLPWALRSCCTLCSYCVTESFQLRSSPSCHFSKFVKEAT